MKKVIAFILCVAMIGTFPILATAAGGENYVSFSSATVDYPTNPHLAGDSNGDGKVNVLDVITSLKYISGNKKGSNRDCIDTNGDGTVNLLDAMLIIEHVLGYNVGLGKIVK